LSLSTIEAPAKIRFDHFQTHPSFGQSLVDTRKCISAQSFFTHKVKVTTEGVKLSYPKINNGHFLSCGPKMSPTPLNIYRGSITVRLTSCLTGLEMCICAVHNSVQLAQSKFLNRSNSRSTVQRYFPFKSSMPIPTAPFLC